MSGLKPGRISGTTATTATSSPLERFLTASKNVSRSMNFNAKHMAKYFCHHVLSLVVVAVLDLVFHVVVDDVGIQRKQRKILL